MFDRHWLCLACENEQNPLEADHSTRDSEGEFVVPREDPGRLEGWRRRLDIIAIRPEDRIQAEAYDVGTNYVTLRPQVQPFFLWPNQQVSNVLGNEFQLHLWTGDPHARVGDPLLLRALDVAGHLRGGEVPYGGNQAAL